MLQFKVGVRLTNLQPQMVLATKVVEEEFSRYGLDTVITSANDGEHMEGSLHYSGRALDFRTKHAQGVMKGIHLAIQKRLAPVGFDVIWEAQENPNEHLHLEWDPKDG
jgi:conjugal transfer mating pair stabilization protein TraG